jgi:hypothetical protein
MSIKSRMEELLRAIAWCARRDSFRPLAAMLAGAAQAQNQTEGVYNRPRTLSARLSVEY